MAGVEGVGDGVEVVVVEVPVGVEGHCGGLTVIQLTAMAFAGAWEIVEFASDQLIGTVSQHDLADT